MSKHPKHNDRLYLNRIALMHERDPFDLNPTALLKKLIESNDRFPFQQNLRKIFIAALGEEYKISENSPENAVYCLNKVEIMLEIAFLVLFQPNRKSAGMKEKRLKKDRNLIKIYAFPCSLSFPELAEPLLVLKEGFLFMDLAAWKRTINLWLEASLSNFSIVEMTDPADLLPFTKKLERMVDALFVLRG
jgi:hypothetical protein